MKKFAKAYQAFDKAFSSVQVYSEFDESQVGSNFPIQFKEIENYQGKYMNALEEIKEGRGKDIDDPLEIDIEYELESIKTDEINYEYILMLIQFFIPTGKYNDELIPYRDEKAIEEVNKYIGDLEKNNPKLAQLMKELWSEIQDDPEEYRDQNVSVLLENRIQTTRYELVEDFAQKWCVNEDNLDFVISKYNANRKRQNGESELKVTSDYNKYKETHPDAVSKLKYWKTVRQDLDELMHNKILPLRRK